MPDTPTPPSPTGQAALRISAQPEGREPAPRSRRRRTVGLVAVGVAVLTTGGGAATHAVGTAVSTVTVQGPAWQCDGTVLGDADDPTGMWPDPLEDGAARRIPVIDTGARCWATWWVTSSRDDVELERLTLPFGGPDTGAAFRIEAARVDEEPVDLLVPDTSVQRFPEPRYETVVPVRRTLSADSTTVAVLVVPADGCSGPGAFGFGPELALSLGPLPLTWSMPEDGEGADRILDDPGLGIAFREGGQSDCHSGTPADRGPSPQER